MPTKSFKAGEVLLAAGAVPEVAYRIQQGSVEMMEDSDGMAMPVAVYDRGQLIGAEELAAGRPMAETAQALGNVIAEVLTKEQAMRLLGKTAPPKAAAKAGKAAGAVKPARAVARPEQRSNQLVPVESPRSFSEFAEDPAASVFKPGLLRRLLKPDFADVYDRLDVRIAALHGDGGDQTAHALMNELNKRRGLRARTVNAALAVPAADERLYAIADMQQAATRWLADNGGDVLIWGERPASGGPSLLRLFTAADGPIDSYRIGDGWTQLALPEPPDGGGAHRLHAAVLAALRTKAAGKLLTVKRDLELLIADARDTMLTETPGLDPLDRAEDRAAIARIYANATRHKRRADDARTAISLLDQALAVFSPDRTAIEWAMAHRDRALLNQFIAERTNDTDALRASIDDIEAALKVLGPTVLPYDWAALNDRLGRALYRLDFDSGDIETLERAMRAFEDALDIFDKRRTPTEWIDTMAHMGQVALVIGRERRSPAILLRAVDACNAVVSARDRRNSPQHWAAAQNNLGSALFLYGRVAGDEAALGGARDAFRTAYGIYLEKGSDRMASVAAKNLAHVERAMGKRQRKAAPRPSSSDLPWQPNPNDPPPLPWEFEGGQDQGGNGYDRDDVWLDDRLR